MPTKAYHKLVRDNIPAIIEATGASCETEILSEADYLRLLDTKLDEELAEYRRDRTVEELADLLEVIYACAAAKGCSREELEAIRVLKAARRGGFEKRILLKTVTEVES